MSFVVDFNTKQILSFNKGVLFSAVEKGASGSPCYMPGTLNTFPINVSEIHFQVNIRTAGIVILAECSWTSKIGSN